MIPRRRRDLAALALLLALCAGFFWRLVLTNQYTFLEGNDLSRQVLPWFQMQVGELQAGRLPLWDPYVHGGQPLIGQTQPGTAYPLNWVLFALPTRHGWIKQSYLHWYFVVIHFIAMAAMYALCRDLRLSRAAAILGGCLYGLGGYMNHVDWPQMLHPASLAPLVLLFTLRSAAGRRPWGSAALGGACLGMTFLGGHHQAPLYTALMASGVWIWAIVRERRVDVRAVARFAAFVAIAGMTSGLQLLPAYEYSKNAVRWVGAENPVGHADKVPYNIHEQFQFNPLTLPGIVLPGMHEHVTAYVGFTAAALALLGCALCWRRIEARVAAMVALGGLLFALGSNFVGHGVLYSLLPALDKARNPSMAIFVFLAGVAMLAAMGLDALATQAADAWLQRVKRAALWFALGMIVLMIFFGRAAQLDIRTMLTAVAAALAAALLHAQGAKLLSAGAAAACLIGLMLTELSWGPSSFMAHLSMKDRHQNLPRMARDAELVKALRSLPGRAQLSNDLVPHSFGDFHGIDVYHGYLASLTRAFHDMDPHHPWTRKLFGVRYWVGKEPDNAWNRSVYESEAGWRIWENAEAFPRVFTVHQATQIRHKDDIQWIYAGNGGKGWDIRRHTFLYTDPPKLETCDGEDAAWLLRREAGLVRIAANMACRGLVVLGDNDYPGWQATVDGEPAQIHSAYTSLRAVEVERGFHLIEMRYRPASVYWGALLTLLGLTFAALLSAWEPRARPSAASAFERA